MFRYFQEAELRLVKHLPDILTLQRDLVKKFQNVTDLTCGTIEQFLLSQQAGSETVYTSFFNCMTHTRFHNVLNYLFPGNVQFKILPANV